jgi:hypothetical protein
MKSTMSVEQDGEQYRDVRVDFAPSDDFKKEIYSIRVSLDKEFGMISESDWTYVPKEGEPTAEVDGDPPQSVLDAYAALKPQAEALAEKEQ